MSRASSSSHSRPQMTLMTFQPAPRKRPSSSWMILPLPRTGPSRRWRLQLTTKVRLSRPSRAASDRPASASGSSISPSPRNAQTRWLDVSCMPAVVQVAVEPRLVDRAERPEAHGDGRELPEIGHEAGVRVAREALRAATPRAGSGRDPLRSAGLRGMHGRTCRAPRDPGRRPGPRHRRRPCHGRSG